MNIFKKSKRTTLSLAIGMSLMGFCEVGYSGFDPKPFLGGLNDALSDSLEEPEKTALGFGEDIIKGFIPTPNTEQKILTQVMQISSQLTQISSQLNIIEKQTLEVLRLQEDTIDLIVNENNANDLSDLVSSINAVNGTAMINSIRFLYEKLNRDGVLPIQGDLYEFALNQCPPSTNTCTPIGQSVSYELFSNNFLSTYQTGFINALTGTGATTLGTINSNYSTYLNKKSYAQIDNTSIAGDYVAIYLSATLPIQETAMAFYQALGFMYNMQAIQLAFHYANPKKFPATGGFISSVHGTNILSSQTGSDGYEESMQLLSKAYANTFLSDTTPSIPLAFGGKTYTYSTQNNTLTPGSNIARPTINVSSLNDYVNSKINGGDQKLFAITKNKLFDPKGKGLISLANGQDKGSLLNNCQIVGAHVPIPANESNTGFTNLRFICDIIQGNNVEYTTGVINFGLPYSYDEDNGYTYPVANLDLAEVNPNEGSVYITPPSGSSISLSDYKPDDNKKTADITTITEAAKDYCPKGDIPNNASNASFQYSNGGGNITSWIAQHLRIEFAGNYLENTELPSKARGSADAPTIASGSSGYIDYPYFGTQSDQMEYPFLGGTVTNYAVTESGHLYAVTQSFPSNSDICGASNFNPNWPTTCNAPSSPAPQSFYLQCIEGDTSCVANKGSLTFDNQIDLVYSASGVHEYNKWQMNLADYNAYQLSIKNHGFYIFDASSFNDWKKTTQTGTPYKAYSFVIPFLDGNTTNQVTNDIEILKSTDGNYRLAFVADTNGNNKGSLQIQVKSGDDWKNYNDASKYLPSTIDPKVEALAGVSFDAGNLTLYYYNPNGNGGIDINATTSVADQYEDRNYKWIADPYAYIDMQTDGNLVIHSSNSSNAIGQLGVKKGTATNPEQILWAANWYGNTDDWNNIQNPKLQSSSSDSKSKESKDS